MSLTNRPPAAPRPLTLKTCSRRPIDDTAPFTRVASVLRASAKEQLDFPAIHALARTRLEGMFPADPESAPFAMEHAEEALTLAVKHDIPSVSSRRTLRCSKHR